jgi:tRNA G10  N-methylase Trm11
MMTRRYRGKTNELFTHFMCNIARASSRFQAQPWSELRLFDPLAGGGTTLLAGLVLGAHVAGVEQNGKDVESTAAFVQQYMRQARIGCQVQKGRVKGAGRRWSFELGRRPRRQCVLAQGDSRDSVQLLAGFKPQLIVTDLPYGIQHHGQVAGLLSGVLPVWASLLPPGGVVAFAWESTRFPCEEMVALVEQVSPLRVFSEGPYTELTHRVDRVIKQRDVLVARK